MLDLWAPAGSERASDRLAQAWVESLDRSAAVGARHHIVPRFLLARFGDESDQLLVRDRSTGRLSTRAASDLAVRDFYTSVSVRRELDSSWEQILSEIEGVAAAIVRKHVDGAAFAGPHPLTQDERFKLDTFVSMQYVRGMRVRRSLEILTDYTMKLLNQKELGPGDIEELDIVPHPNDHLRMMGRLAEHAFEILSSRPVVVVFLDKPWLFIGDEPVVFSHDGPSREANTDGFPNVSGPGIDPHNIVQFQNQRGVGFAEATEILMPLSPNAVLVYGPVGDTFPTARARLSGREAESAAHELNTLILDAAVDWVAAHPAHPTFGSMRMPRPTAIVRVIDGGSPMARKANTTTTRRPINRVRARDVDDVLDVDLVPQRAPRDPNNIGRPIETRT